MGGRRRYVLTGLSRLSVRVARLLHDGGADVVVVVTRGDDADLAVALPPGVGLVTGGADRAAALAAPDIDVTTADALLALDDDDLENLRTVSCAAAVAPDVPVVLRSFDAALADQLEVGSNVRRAYSLSALAAPSFVAAAVGGAALQTLRLGADEVPFVRLGVRSGGPLDGRTPTDVADRSGVTIVARPTRGSETDDEAVDRETTDGSAADDESTDRETTGDGRESVDRETVDRETVDRETVDGSDHEAVAAADTGLVDRRATGNDRAADHRPAADTPLRGGDIVIVAGRRHDVLRFALANDPLPEPPNLARRLRMAPSHELRRPRAGITSTLLPATAGLLVLLVLGATIAFGASRDLGFLDALYFTVTTAWGEAALGDAGPWQQVTGLALMIGVGALVGVLFSHVAAIAAAERSEHRMARQARRRKGHAVVVGVGTIGYRVIRLLDDLDVDVVAIEGAAGSRFVGAAAVHGPVLVGDARLPEDLARTAVDRASCLLAVTDDDLVNISACLQAKAANPGIRTVARVFDETVADHVGHALGIDVVLSASRSAAPAFAGAAMDDRAPRQITVDHLERVAFRHAFGGGLPPAAEQAAWSAEGVHLVATEGTMAIVCGPRDAPTIQHLLRA